MKVLKVNDLKKVDTARYQDGDMFYTEKEIGQLHNGEIKQFVHLVDLKGYVKKTDLKAEVKKQVAEALKEVK